MKITVTGALGRISKPLAQELIQNGHTVTVISSNPERQKDIEALGAKPAIGTIEDAAFLITAFTGADAVYLMEPPVNFFDKDVDVAAYWTRLAAIYVKAVRQSGVKRIVHLSSIGAHTDKGNGMLAAHYEVEQILKTLPSDITITTLRPVGFYYNFFGFIQGIKTNGSIITNYSASYKEPWVSPIDIAAAAAEELTKPFEGRNVRYAASDEQTSDDIATILGSAIGRPDLQWITIDDEQMLNGLISAGMNPQCAKGLTEMNAARQNAVLYEDYYRNKPILGQVKIKDFAKEFAAVFSKS